MPGWLRGNVLALGVVSLLNDAASEMIAPFLPLFVATMLGGGATALGAIEGLGEATANVLKLVSGRRSDRGRRLPWLLGGYGLSVVTKPLIAMAAAPWHVALVRVLDRTGKGLRTSPRDALIADAVAKEHRGAAFGFHRAMDHAGAVLGPLSALGLLAATHDDLRLVFALSAIPGALVLLAIVFGVRETPRPDPGPAKELAPTPWGLIVPIALFAMARAPDGLVLLTCTGENADPKRAAVLWALLHVVKSTLSTPLGGLSDRLGRRRSLGVSWAWAIGVYVALAFATTEWGRTAAFLAWGVHYAFGEGAEKALISEHAEKGHQGAAFGAYHLAVGLVAIPGGLILGALWDARGPEAAFLWGAALAGVALVAMFAQRERA